MTKILIKNNIIKIISEFNFNKGLACLMNELRAATVLVNLWN